MDTCDVIPQNKAEILNRSLEKKLEVWIDFSFQGGKEEKEGIHFVD